MHSRRAVVTDLEVQLDLAARGQDADLSQRVLLVLQSTLAGFACPDALRHGVLHLTAHQDEASALPCANAHVREANWEFAHLKHG